MNLCPKCNQLHGQIHWKEHPSDFNEFPRCKKCGSNHDYEVELISKETNTWKVTCRCCGFTEAKAHAMAVYVKGKLVN